MKEDFKFSDLLQSLKPGTANAISRHVSTTMSPLEIAVWANIYTAMLERGGTSRLKLGDRFAKDDHARIAKAVDTANEAVVNLRNALGLHHNLNLVEMRRNGEDV